MSVNIAPLVSVAVCVFKNDKILLSRRRKSPESNTWQCPGGPLNSNESIFECAHRIVLFKTNLMIHRLNYGPYTNNRFTQQDSHTVTLYASADYLSGEIDASRYSQAQDWQWFSLDDLPAPLFLPLKTLLSKHSAWLKSTHIERI